MDLRVLEFNLHVNRFLIKSPRFNPWICCLLALQLWARHLSFPSLCKTCSWQHGPSHLLKRALFHSLCMHLGPIRMLFWPKGEAGSQPDSFQMLLPRCPDPAASRRGYPRKHTSCEPNTPGPSSPSLMTHQQHFSFQETLLQQGPRPHSKNLIQIPRPSRPLGQGPRSPDAATSSHAGDT